MFLRFLPHKEAGIVTGLAAMAAIAVAAPAAQDAPSRNSQ